MSPLIRFVGLKRHRRVLAGILVEMAYAAGLCAFCCLVCALAFYLAG